MSETPAGWLSDRELENVAPADRAPYRSPMPASILSNRGVNLAPQTAAQGRVDSLILGHNEKYAEDQGVDRRVFLKCASGFAAMFLSINKGFGPVFGVSEAEAAEDDKVLVSTEWLAGNLQAADQRILDCSWYLPALKRDARADFRAKHLPGAVFFDIDEIADRTGLGAHMLPSAEVFAEKVGRLGIDNQTRVVVYDTNYVSARVWWMFRVFGHDNVVVLNGHALLGGTAYWLSRHSRRLCPGQRESALGHDRKPADQTVSPDRSITRALRAFRSGHR